MTTALIIVSVCALVSVAANVLLLLGAWHDATSGRDDADALCEGYERRIAELEARPRCDCVRFRRPAPRFTFPID